MKPYIMPHHKRAIDNLVAEYEHDPRFEAIIIGGSVAKGYARVDSDIDFMIVANDREFSERKKSGDFFINRTDLTDYQHGFVDGKVVDLSYLHKVAEKGNEPSRAAFDGAFVGFSRVNQLDKIIESISNYPEDLREEKLKRFYSMSFIQNWLMGEAQRHNNQYTKARAASQLVLFTGRLILAYNRVFFPYHKWFYNYLDKCLEKPENLLNNMNQLLKQPSALQSQIVFDSVKGFQDWGVTDLEAFSWFMEDIEWGWMDNNASLEDW